MSLEQKFIEIFGESGGKIYTFHSPGRVNLIGEHTDYNGGYVFPCALSFGTYGLVRKREDNVLRFFSVNFNDTVSLTLDDLSYNEEHGWANYLKGIIAEFEAMGFNKTTGLEVLIKGDIPNGSGLSSSASIELLMSVILNDLFGCNISMLDMVKLSQKVENQYIGVNCGIMDQFAVGMGRKDMAMLLKCDDLTYEYVPVELGDYCLVIGNTTAKRGLADSKYNERRSQCEAALKDLQENLAVNYLCSITPEEFEANKSLIKDETNKKRAEHAVYENARTIEACEKLRNGDLTGFGILMNQSHDSLKDLYEVTGSELDAMAYAAREADGCIGSRMTGAGFGGCTVSIVQKDKSEEFINYVSKKYKEQTGLDGEFYIGEVGSGAGIVE